ncbi:MAG: beta-Ala-His dipeptidase [Lachnospiraceae bacterium]|nr:beta-Ala-His dipeptidase [Lachnospiraceae bacterium]
MREISELEPKRVFWYFDEICHIPHGTGHTEAMSDYVEAFAGKHDLFCYRDEYGNVLIRKAGSEGREDERFLILQVHLDAFCDGKDQRLACPENGSSPISLATIDDYIYAKGGPLGADGGIGIAYILAVLEDKTLSHPPLEAVFTVDAEDGMRGVLKMDLSVLSGRRMINFGHFSEGEILTGSAGGRMIVCEVPVRYVSEYGVLYDIVICGLKGGHAGMEIDRYRGNAALIMGRLLHYLDLYMDYELFYLKGGMHYNYIPREAKASLLIRQEDINRLEDLIDRFNEALLKEYRDVEDNLTIYCENKGEGLVNVLTEKTKQRVIFLLMMVPDGIQRMSMMQENIVQTSSNVGIMSLNQDTFVLHIGIRSLLASEKHALSDKLQFLTENIGGSFHILMNYHAWEYEEESPLREELIEIYREMYRVDPELTLIHSGLECGIISDKIRDMDIVSFGPTIESVNTSKERLCISSVERVWQFLIRALARIKG